MKKLVDNIDILERTLKAKVKKINQKVEHTGMCHLDDDGVLDKSKRFPEGAELRLEPAHWFGEVRVYRGYAKNGDWEYFSSDELSPIVVTKDHHLTI